MTVIKDFNLQEERDRLQSQLTLLDDIFRKKVAFEAENKKLLEITDIQQLSTKLATLEEDLAAQRAEIESHAKGHEVKTQQWKVKSEKSDSILFTVYASLKTSDPEPDDLDQLKIAAERAKETFNLFAQMLHIRELKKSVPSLQSAIDEAKLSLSTEKLREDLKHLSQSLKSSFEKAEAEFHQNHEAELQKQIKSMASRISQSESRNSIFGINTTGGSEQIICNLYSRIHKLESDLRTKNQLVDTLQAKVAFLSFDDHQIAPFVNATDNTTQKKVNLAFMKRRDQTARRLSPLAIAGRYIRARKLEWQKKDNKDEALVELGNLSSHYGMALADATLFQDFCPSPRTDFNTYMDLYVLHPNFVWRNQDCPKLLHVLDWCGAMKDIHGHAYTRIFFDKTTFYQLSRKLLSPFHDHEDDWDVEKLNKYFSDRELNKTYEKLKKGHDTAFREHQDHLESKRG